MRYSKVTLMLIFNEEDGLNNLLSSNGEWLKKLIYLYRDKYSKAIMNTLRNITWTGNVCINKLEF